MSSSLNQFDRIAGWYDTLAGLIFGKAIRNAQIAFLHRLPDQGNILILGGGTGWILKEICTLRKDVNIWYVEASQAMITQASANNVNGNIHFIHGTENSIPSQVQFDAVITHFYLDLFTYESLDKVVSRILSSMKKNGLWLASDFDDQGKWWQKILLKVMYRFFRITCKIEAANLPDWKLALTSKVRLVEEKTFFRGFIRSAAFELSE